MNNYSNLSVEDLFVRYVSHDEEREAIDSYALTLPEPVKELFLNLKKRNAGALELEPSPFDGTRDIIVFRVDLQGAAATFLVYNPLCFDSFRSYIDDLAAVKTEDPELLQAIMEAELKKCKRRLKAIKRERLDLSSISSFKANIDKKQEVEKCFAYLQQLYSSGIEPDAVEKQPARQNTETPLSLNSRILEARQLRAKEYLRHLSGHNQRGRAILGQKDYERLLSYTNHLVWYEQVPEKIEPIHRVEVSQKHISYTYYQMYVELYKKGVQRQIFIEFLYAVFPSLFRNVKKSVLNSKFSDPPVEYDQKVKFFLDKIGGKGG